MHPFSFADLTDLETAGSQESLGSKLGLMIRNSSSVRARVEELTFGTGEYAIVLRGVLRRTEEQSETPGQPD
jgi:hypothetical protein